MWLAGARMLVFCGTNLTVGILCYESHEPDSQPAASSQQPASHQQQPASQAASRSPARVWGSIFNNNLKNGKSIISVHILIGISCSKLHLLLSEKSKRPHFYDLQALWQDKKAKTI